MRQNHLQKAPSMMTGQELLEAATAMGTAPLKFTLHITCWGVTYWVVFNVV